MKHKGERKLILDVFDYVGNNLCNLYDNMSDASGQATEVCVVTERNGARTLTFMIPTTCQTEDGEEENYRLQFLKPDYRIRLIDDKETDWFLLSSPRVTHQGFSKNITVQANHVSQLLKTKNLGLEFSDTEGNNTGRPIELLTTILEGTGWIPGDVKDFYEDDGSIKVRSLKASAKTGAFKLISNMCDLFEAKPVYHAEAYPLLTEDPGDMDTNYQAYCTKENGQYIQLSSATSYAPNTYYRYKAKTVDILPMNPFSEPEPGEKYVLLTEDPGDMASNYTKYYTYDAATYDYIQLTGPATFQEDTYYTLEHGDNLPILDDADGVLELAFGVNVKSVSTTMNSDNLVTKLYAYGSYGDTVTGYCGIDECTHTEYTFTLTDNLINGQTYYFSVLAKDGKSIYRHFVAPGNGILAGTTLIYSLHDPASMLYLWKKNVASDTGIAIPLEEGRGQNSLPMLATVVKEEKTNWASFLMDFDYFKENGALTDDMIQKIAEYQRSLAINYPTVNEKSSAMSINMTELSKIIGQVDLAKLNISSVENDDGYCKLILNTESQDSPKGIYWRTDYATKESQQFKFKYSDTLDNNGDPMIDGASIIYILHDTDPLTWDIAYCKMIDNKDPNFTDKYIDPTYITIWMPYTDNPIDISTDSFYLFAQNSVNGKLGSLQSSEEALLRTIKDPQSGTTIVTTEHPIIWLDSNPVPESGGVFPDLDSATIANLNGYGWAYCMDGPGIYGTDFYFCYSRRQDTKWHPVFVESGRPGTSDIDDATKRQAQRNGILSNMGCYWFNWKTSKLYRSKDVTSSTWKWDEFDTDSELRTASYFGMAYYFCMRRKQINKGIYDKYIYTHQSDTPLPIGNYYFDNGFGGYWCFTTKDILHRNDTLMYDSSGSTTFVIQSVAGESGTVQTQLAVNGHRFDNVKYHKENILDDDDPKTVNGGIAFEKGGLAEKTGEEDSSIWYRSVPFIKVYPETTYIVQDPPPDGEEKQLLEIFYFNDKKQYLGYQYRINDFDTIAANKVVNDDKKVGPSDEIDPEHDPVTGEPFYDIIDYIRICAESKDKDKPNFPRVFSNKTYNIHADNLDVAIIIDDVVYTKLDCEPYQPQPGETNYLTGIEPLMDRFRILVEQIYEIDKPALEEAQAVVTKSENDMNSALGDLLREGYWQKSDYVDGDEDRLYADAWSNIKEVSKPDISYDIAYLDLYDSQPDDDDYGASAATIGIAWPDLSIASAVHLIDPAINVNCWAFIDKIAKYYDQPWKTSISINTNLSTIGQHSFKDVMTHIAEVASEFKAKQTKYDAVGNIKITSAGLANGSIVGGNIANGTITSLNIADSGISIDKISNFKSEVASTVQAYLDNLYLDSSKINNLRTDIKAGAITAVKIEAEKITAQDIAADSLAAAMVTAINAKINSAEIDTAQIKHLEAGSVQAETFETYVGKLSQAEIGSASIGWAQIKSLDAETAFFDNTTVSGHLYASDLAVTAANVVSLNADVITAGTLVADRLLLRGENSVLYKINQGALSPAEEQAMLETERPKYFLNGSNIQANTITAKCLNVQEMFVNTATINDIIASHISTNTLRVSQINSGDWETLDLSSNTSIRIHTGTNLYNDVVGVTKISDPFISGTQVAPTSRWTGTTNVLSSLEDGQKITYWLPYAYSSSDYLSYTPINGTAANGVGLELTLSGGTSTGSLPCFYGGITRITNQYAAGNVIHLTYRTNVQIGDVTVTAGWWADANYNVDTYNRIRWQSTISATSSAGITINKLIVSQDGQGYYDLGPSTTFIVSNPILYARSTVAAGASGTNNYLCINDVSLRTISGDSTWSGTAGRPVYIAGYMDGDTFTTLAANWITDTPSVTSVDIVVDSHTITKDVVYMSIGTLSSAYQMYFSSDHKIFYPKSDGTNITLTSSDAEFVVTKNEIKSTVSGIQTFVDNNVLTTEELESKIVQTAEGVAETITKTQWKELADKLDIVLSDLTWILSMNLDTQSVTYATTDYFSIVPGSHFTYTGDVSDGEDDLECKLYIYDSNNVALDNYTMIISGSKQQYEIDNADVAYARIVFGRAASTTVQITTSDISTFFQMSYSEPVTEDGAISKAVSWMNQTKTTADSVTKTFSQWEDNYGEGSRIASTYLKESNDGLEIGKSDSDFITRLDNEKLAFIQKQGSKDVEVAYISNMALMITQALIKNSFTLGGLSAKLDGYAVNWVLEGDTLLIKRNYLGGTETPSESAKTETTVNNNYLYTGYIPFSNDGINSAPLTNLILSGIKGPYTLSFDYEISNLDGVAGDRIIGFYLYPPDSTSYPFGWSAYNTYNPGTNTSYKGHFVYTFSFTDEQAQSTMTRMRIRFAKLTPGQYENIKITHLKLEQNSEATEWVPALED